jgi:hypothetical protein
MAEARLIPLDRPEIEPRRVSSRLRGQLIYFSSPAGGPGVPVLGEGEYYFAAEDVERWLDEGAISLISPLDTANRTEVELSEEQEALLEWLRATGVRHARLEE